MKEAIALIQKLAEEVQRYSGQRLSTEDQKRVDDVIHEIETLRKRVAELEDVLTSTRAICERRGDLTAWERLDARIAKLGIGKITPRTFRVLPSDILDGWIERAGEK